MESYQICTRCVLDTTVPSIKFDKNGVCNFCKSYDRIDSVYDMKNKKNQIYFQNLIKKIKKQGKNKKYDCIVGISGGTDSSYTLYTSKKLGLRILAVHLDNGWDTKEATKNMKKIITKLDVDFLNLKTDWEEFKDLQIAFLKASVPCIEAPSDVGIHGALMKIANERNIKYILGGQSFRNEGIVPRKWSYLDGNYIKSVYKKYGKNKKLKSFPNLTISKILYYTFIKGIRSIPLLNYIDYSKEKAKKELKKEFGWEDYGEHHYENIYTKFTLGWYEYHKFKFDKRRAYLSGPVRAGIISRDEALKKLETPPNVKREIVEYCIKKLGLTEKEFEYIMNAPNRTYQDFFTSESILKYLKIPIKIATKLKIITPVLYEKFIA